jgi:DNA-binding transcriptional LysR family regulator
MDINTLEAFLSLADNLNFTKSAEHLYISQPAFSRKITRLEDEFECKLFTRNKRTVELTEYGRVFYEYAKDIYAAYSKWNMNLKQLKSKKSGRLRIGFLQDLPHNLFPDSVQKFQTDYDQIDLTFMDCSMTDIIDRLLCNEIDIGFSLSEEAYDHEKISHRVLAHIPLCVAMPDNHRLADKVTVDLNDLRDEPFVMISMDNYGPGSRHIKSLCNFRGFEPNISAFTTFVPSLLILVKSGIGITIVAKTAEHVAPIGVKLTPLSNDVPPTKLVLLWKTSNSNPAIPEFIDTCFSLSKGYQKSVG